MRKLTNRQKEVLQAIMQYTEKHKFPPTVRELCDILNLASSSTIHQHLKSLKVKGLISWEPGCPRTLKINDNKEVSA